ncbi:ARM repeats containing protein, putative [Perkinsus marinus ATCC 50983]|uniref:ARM repeats containing protein, putative n=1 Tax=Perkinsus marinus (strain ATCC 50983 / TXsc) TaxID=423536 RepID=C5KRS1_PERM5|nr:ARM repeats containing protein, putative [Perkinsus marinus ATCC 50983]EER12762.1 ARM repeats containing protein, putative [Perkinsus marinus ATCC 50983]|eukprot:XP_002780967.1 ARM repeats containing protein, putative [Perkinsus marinus ATCC 50983]
MGNNCCFDREYTRYRAKSLLEEYGLGSTDYHTFVVASHNHDYERLVELLSSLEPYSMPENSDAHHAWADNPRSIGVIAGTRLAIAAYSEGEDVAREAKDRVRLAGGIASLVDFVRSPESTKDRVDCGLVALSYLAIDCPPNCQEMYQHGLFPLLFPFMDSPVEGVRSTAFSLASNIYRLSPRYRYEFVERGGVPLIIRHIRGTADSIDSDWDAVEALQDLVTADSGKIDEKIAMAIVQERGALRRIQTLKKSPEKDLSQAASRLEASLVPSEKRLSS